MKSRMNYDLVVIGSGAAGHHGAIQGAKLGKRVAVIERGSWLGGATINTGMIPSKTVREAVLRPTNHGENLVDRIERVAVNESTVYANQFRRNAVDVLTGEASFVSPNLIRVKNGTKTRSLKRIAF